MLTSSVDRVDPGAAFSASNIEVLFVVEANTTGSLTGKSDSTTSHNLGGIWLLNQSVKGWGSHWK